jgi:hypothetical protein
VLDSLHAVSTPTVAAFNITHVNHPPIALVVNLLPLQGVMNQPIIVTLGGQDPDNDPVLSVSFSDILG